MKQEYILDVNVLFSGVLSQKEIYRIIFNEFEFYTPDFALIELNKYREVILKKSKTPINKLKEFTVFLFSKVVVIPDYVISEQSFNQAVELCKDIDINDVVYIALSIELKFPILTRDTILYNGLKNKGFSQIKLFDELVREILDNKRNMND